MVLLPLFTQYLIVVVLIILLEIVAAIVGIVKRGELVS